MGTSYLRQVSGAAVGTFYPHPWAPSGVSGGRFKSPYTTREPVVRFAVAVVPVPAVAAQVVVALGSADPPQAQDEAHSVAAVGPALAADSAQAQDEAQPVAADPAPATADQAPAPAPDATNQAPAPAPDAPVARNARRGLGHFKWRSTDKYVLILSGTPLLDSGPKCMERGPGLVKYMRAAHLTGTESEALRAWSAGMAPRQVPRLDGVAAGDDDTLDMEPLCTLRAALRHDIAQGVLSRRQHARAAQLAGATRRDAAADGEDLPEVVLHPREGPQARPFPPPGPGGRRR